MALEMEGLTGVAHGERSPDRITHRNGDRERSCETRSGTAALEDPEDRLRRREPGLVTGPTEHTLARRLTPWNPDGVSSGPRHRPSKQPTASFDLF